MMHWISFYLTRTIHAISAELLCETFLLFSAIRCLHCEPALVKYSSVPQEHIQFWYANVHVS